MRKTILVRGSGDIGSAAAYILFQARYQVLIHETPQPAATRRKMAFTDAVFDGSATLEGLEARRVDDVAALPAALSERKYIPLAAMDFVELLDFLKPWALVDARMRKRAQPELQIHLAALTIGLGPNFVAGETVHIAVETGWGDDLGRVIERGSTRPLVGEPREIEGHARDRYVYAPADGVFHALLQIGDRVEAGQEVALINDIPLLSPIRGVLRGLTRSGVFVSYKTKVIEVDPRLENAQVSGIAERPARIAKGVLQAVQKADDDLSASRV